MDFLKYSIKKVKKDEHDYDHELVVEIDCVGTKDLLVKGNSFYALWSEKRRCWILNEQEAFLLIKDDIYENLNDIRNKNPNKRIKVKDFGIISSRLLTDYKLSLQFFGSTSIELNTKLFFKSEADKRVREDYSSQCLPYDLSYNFPQAYDELMSVLFSEVEREKLEWAVGSIFCGDSINIQKFIVLYGDTGTGKSTFLNILQKLFAGYYIHFDAAATGSNSDQFSTAPFAKAALVAIEHDGDLSRIENNIKLNSIISHEPIFINEKNKPRYLITPKCFLFMGTNKIVKFVESKSGLLRRIIDVFPSGNKVSPERYDQLVYQIDFELGDIANHCMQVYTKLGKYYYDKHRPKRLILKSDIVYNFIKDNIEDFLFTSAVSGEKAYKEFKNYCKEYEPTYIPRRLKFYEEFDNYFTTVHDRSRINGVQLRHVCTGFKKDKFDIYLLQSIEEEMSKKNSDDNVQDAYVIELKEQPSVVDTVCENILAQYATKTETPKQKWSDVKTTLKDIDTSKLHYVLLDEHHIVIDFDIKDTKGEKSLETNLAKANDWPPTYAEVSKSGKGIHLHYIYDGDPTELSGIYDSNGIEIKVFTGNSALRRKLTLCNDKQIAHISSGLPLKKGGAMINTNVIKSEKKLYELINRNLLKEFHNGTKPSIDFIYKLLTDAYNSGLHYDLTTMRPAILAFANNSTHHAEYCVGMVNKMPFKSDEISENIEQYNKDELVFFDCEVFPNLFVVVWKKEGKDAIAMINPTGEEIEKLFDYKLIGFNNRQYDNHILYARTLGYSLQDLFNLSQKIIKDTKNGTFNEAYNISYTDIYDFSSKKQSLKRFEIELGIHHQELGYKWDEEIPEENWDKVVEYCKNDVVATEAVFHARKQDFVARQILADLSGLTVNDTTRQHTEQIIFGDDRYPQEMFQYTDLREQFKGYTFDNGKSIYQGEYPGEGGYVYSEPGIYYNVALLDIASMHPTSLISMNMFGPYTENYKQLLDARLAIKHKDYNAVKSMLGGKLEKYLGTDEDADALAYSLKIVINIVYGLTSSIYNTRFKDFRNKDNIVAKRGSLFMIDLKRAVQDKGFKVIHIKTDSIKIPDATDEIIEFVVEFGKKYGYTFEYEAKYKKMCLFNDAVYVAYVEGKDKKPDHWIAVGTELIHPYTFKTLFSKEEVTLDDLSEARSVKTSLYLDMNEDLPEGEHKYVFVGKVGLFYPVIDGCGGGKLYRETNGKYQHVTKTKDWRWKEREVVDRDGLHDQINMDFFYTLTENVRNTISKFGNVEEFLSV
ncbi:MAG: DUF5906 domain-containing protein [Endomicrobium sp.]|jgi:energy-coupling factor transporter ATP-binding protein EcfA2|uniref:DUF5906 domain-containing protein n=1 Tax=Candidatus Endomicrobiellum cubanum TaxID=3242325 RepID=UPI0028192EF9|nr:DUF5906 domain-containing protein [Endomicrobium sp.]